MDEYFEFKNIPGHGLCALQRMIYTVGLFVGITETSYRGRYCYPDLRSAIDGIREWDGTGDPPGDWIKYKGVGGERRNEKVL